MTYTERNQATLWPPPLPSSSSTINIYRTTMGCKSSAFTSSNVIWLSFSRSSFPFLFIYVCRCECACANADREIVANKKRKLNVLVLSCPIYHIFRYCSMLLWTMCGGLSFISFRAHSVHDLFVLATESGCLCSLFWVFLFVDVILERMNVNVHCAHTQFYWDDQWVLGLRSIGNVRIQVKCLKRTKSELIGRICYWNRGGNKQTG